MKLGLHLDDRTAFRSAIFETLQATVSLSTSATSDCFVSFSLDLSSSDGSVPESWEKTRLGGSRNEKRNEKTNKQTNKQTNKKPQQKKQTNKQKNGRKHLQTYGDTTY